MKKTIFILLVSFLFGVSINAQTDSKMDKNADTKTEVKTKKQIFRANKEQVMKAQKMLNVAESGKLDTETRAAIKKYQPENGLKATGTLNRATLEKMGIELTDKQKEIPVSPNSFAIAEGDKMDKPKRTIFRANKEQVMQAQKILQVEESGKLDDATRAGLKKYQAENDIKATGTLNQVTLEKMGIELTDKQKGMPMSDSSADKLSKSDKMSKSDEMSDSGDVKTKKTIFRANKEQIMQAQKLLKVEESGKLDDATRNALKEYQTANGIKSTGTLNQITLEKMGIELTDKQKGMMKPDAEMKN